MINKFYFVFLVSVGISVSALSQSNMDQVLAVDSVFTVPDSIQRLDLDEFYALILEYHPVVRQADLLTDIAQQEIRLARGGFDPKLQASWSVKDFKGTRYWNILDTELKIPVYFPLDAKIEFDRNLGEFLNPERSIPESNEFQQLFMGVSLPVGRGLFIDQRRATLNQAKIFAELTEFERIKLINKILLEAAKDYWNWYYAYYEYRLLQSAINLAEEIFTRVKLNYELGEASVIDTVQASITLQNRTNDARLARINFLQTGLVLTNYFWDSENYPLTLINRLVPEFLGKEFFEIREDIIDRLLTEAEANHPELRKIDFKLEQINIENRLSRENLKPELNLSYGWIDEPISGTGEGNGFSFNENYKFGLDFSFPILLRKERSKVEKIKLKTLDLVYERELRQREILNQVQGTYLRIVNTDDILEQQWSIVDSYRRLVEAEFLNLNSGESDLFKINIQQDKYIESFIKGLKTQIQLEKDRAELYWAAGIQNLEPNF
jgi:outer membrane protein TolC